MITLHEFRTSVGAFWPFLSDPGRTIQKDLDVQEYTDPEHDPMVAHTLVRKRAWSSTASTTATRSGAGPRWTAGDRAHFHGWDKRNQESMIRV